MTYVATGASSWWIHTIHDSYDSLYLYRFVWHRTMWWKKICKDHVYIHWKHTTYFEQSAIPLANLLTGAQHVASVLDLLGRVKEYDVHGGIVMLRPMSTHDYQWPIMTNELQWYCNFKTHDYQNLNSYLKNNQSPMQYREVYQDYTVCILCVSMYKGTTAPKTECCSKRCGYSKHVDVHDSCRRCKLVKLQEPIACNSLSQKQELLKWLYMTYQAWKKCMQNATFQNIPSSCPNQTSSQS